MCALSTRRGFSLQENAFEIEKVTPNSELTFGSSSCPSGSHTFGLIRQSQCVLDNSFLFWALLMNLLVCTLRFDKARKPETSSDRPTRNPQRGTEAHSSVSVSASLPVDLPTPTAGSYKAKTFEMQLISVNCRLQFRTAITKSTAKSSLTIAHTHTDRHNSSLTLLWHRTQMETEMGRDRGIGMRIEIEQIMLMQ